MAELDASLRRVERDAIIIGVVMAGAALVIQDGRPGGALGVVGGGALMALSYRSIKGGVDAVVRRVAGNESSGSRRRGLRALVGVVFRYALLAAGAYVILIPLRAHPLGVIAGVTAPVVAIALEAARLQWQKSS
jgi:hypothetical protein